METERVEFVNPEPRQREEYGGRQVEAARRVLVDIGQILASFSDCMVVVGGWVPDLLLENADEPHIGSIDVDIALDAAKLGKTRYAEMLKLLLETKRYKPGPKEFQLVVEVDLGDSEKPVLVEVDFLAPKDVKLKGGKPKLLPGFRVLQTEGCNVAFHAPVEQTLSGRNVRGADNTVRLRMVSLPDYLVMKAHAIGSREKPKDSYDLCYCLQNFDRGMEILAENWKKRAGEKEVTKAVEILREKFASPNTFGPQQLVEFYNVTGDDAAMQARRAYELIQAFLKLIG